MATATTTAATTTPFQAVPYRLSTAEAENCIRNAGPVFRVVPGKSRLSPFTVSFTLRPPSHTSDDVDPTFGLAVFTEWQKAHGPSSRDCGDDLSLPNLSYSETKGIFTLDLSLSHCDEQSLRNALSTLAAEALQEATSRHLTEGGDERLHLTPSGNKYFCPPHPVPNAIIRGTCTCSPPSRNAFNAACARLNDIWNGVESLDDAFDDTRRRISAVLALRTRHHIILHPSGTDAEYTPLLIATLTAASLGCTGVVNVVTGLGEVGSNTPNAAAGTHFSEYVPLGSNSNLHLPTPTPSTLVRSDSSLPDGTTVLSLSARSPDGSLLPDFDTTVLNSIPPSDPTSKSDPFYIIHAVDGSKLGSRITTRHLVTTLQSRLGARSLTVLDACQGRTESEELDWYLSRGAVVLMTASKFYSAPGFCGMAIVPDSVAGVLKKEGIQIGEGLGGYLGQMQVPKALPGLRGALPGKPVNVGLLLRWACGVSEMERVARAGAAAREGIRRWVGGVREVMGGCGFLEVLEEREGEGGHASQLGGVNSIVPFKVFGAEGAPMKTAGLKKVHRLLTADGEGLLPGEASEEEREMVRLRCFIGQPVDMGGYAVLRFAIGAALAAELGEDPDFLETALREDRKVLDKIGVLLKYHEVL
ncbi:pyridoxal phosphate-dependent transferase, major region, subdomain 1 [Podospora aff. communis PSN243]|uniref:Pyridoxal phosphate-dependent transferase, major region, subdomain 1 n=1 Tax=Podospora aff. communis PSN243 TaxID=3040156 RepID=A0AAV9GDK2_9PEZI|nr:pyridoxal phosphate-dependent transferase, major region, subdomain 1 [Podospora aff. communis PSN243]